MFESDERVEFEVYNAILDLLAEGIPAGAVIGIVADSLEVEPAIVADSMPVVAQIFGE